MDISKVLEQLRRDLEHLNAAIVSLERLQQKDLRRDRPPRRLPEPGQPKPATSLAGRRQIRRGNSSVE